MCKLIMKNMPKNKRLWKKNYINIVWKLTIWVKISYDYAIRCKICIQIPCDVSEQTRKYNQ